MKHSKKKKNSALVVVLALLLVLALSITLFFALGGHEIFKAESEDDSMVPSEPVVLPASSQVGSGAGSQAQTYPSAALPEEMRAMWISYLEWNNHDITTEAALRGVASAMFDNCKALGMNTVIVAVRPFGDALYKSTIYPWSHLITGTQGKDPGYDPLTVLVEEAHARGLRIEAWINPYRIKHATMGPEVLASDNPASLHPAWVRGVNGALFYDPGLPEVQQMVVDGVAEIVQNYDVDGINFDDYFYPDGHDDQFDAETFAQYGGGKARADWRRNNVNTLVRSVYAAIKGTKPTLPFGISPQGNNDNNYNGQFSDVKLWMATPGYVDYVMPQLYWGFNWTKNGSDRYAFAKICNEWAGYSKAGGVKLYAALGAYRIGGNDGGDGDQSEWSTGHNIADQITFLRGAEGFSGFSLFRYEFLYDGTELAKQESEAIRTLM